MKNKIDLLLLDERFYSKGTIKSGNFEYVLGEALRLDLVHIIMKLDEIINVLNKETK